MSKFCLEPSAVIWLNQQLLGRTGTLIDSGKLESALAAPLQTFGGRLLYTSPLMRAFVLLRGICAAHAFEDGNKRTAWVAFASYLEMSGYRLADIADGEVADFVESVTLHKVDEETALEWICDHLDLP